MHIALKKANNGDIEDLRLLEESVSAAKTYSPMLSEDEWIVALDIGTVYLIEADGQTVGNVSIEPKPFDSAQGKKGGRAHISGLVIDPRFQGKGIGRKAMELVLKELKDAKVIDLAVHPDNERALKLYESLGFEIGELKKNYYGDGEPRLILELRK